MEAVGASVTWGLAGGRGDVVVASARARPSLMWNPVVLSAVKILLVIVLFKNVLIFIKCIYSRIKFSL